MRTKEEVQHAHDVLCAIIEDDLLEFEPGVKLHMHAARDALCYALKDSNPAFEKNLQELVGEMSAKGVKLVKYTSHSE